MKRTFREMFNQGERGAAIVEYAFLMGAIVIVLLGSLQFMGQHVAGDFEAVLALGQENSEPQDETVDVAGQSVAGGGAAPIPDLPAAAVKPAGTCPNGWNLISNTETKKNGQDVDANNDGLICEKQIPGNGKGNTNQNTNIKDNSGG